MSRTPKIKQLENTRLANAYGGWIYCESCHKTIGYLCYVTYDSFRLAYKCGCGGGGSVHIAFDAQNEAAQSEQGLTTVKNRLCCPKDGSPLFTLLSKNLDEYQYEVRCAACGTSYRV